MKSLYFLGYYLNGLELVTYVLIPTAMVLVILTYIFFNIRIMTLSFDTDLMFLKELDISFNKKLKKTQDIIDKLKILDEKLEIKDKIVYDKK